MKSSNRQSSKINIMRDHSSGSSNYNNLRGHTKRKQALLIRPSCDYIDIPKSSGLYMCASGSSFDPKPRLSSVNALATRTISWDQSRRYTDDRNSIYAPKIFILEQAEEILRLPLPPQKALIAFSNKLTEFEKKEIIEFDDIYYVGRGNKGEAAELDDEKKNLVVCQGDHIAYRYEILEMLGIGSFSQVYKAFDWKHKKKIAIKIIRNKDKLFKQAKIEVNILKFIRDNSPVMPLASLINSFIFRNHICIVMKKIGKPLRTQELQITKVLHYSLDILTGLCYLHQNSIIHCDLKPSNILISKANTANIIDFGTSCYRSEQSYSYIQSRSYRAPEIIFRLKYTEKIDMWSFGCILYEMCTGKVLFTSISEKDLVREIVEIIGKSPAICLKGSEKLHAYQNELNSKKNKSLCELMHGVCADLINLVKDCLQWDVTKRVSAMEAFAIINSLIANS